MIDELTYIVAYPPKSPITVKDFLKVESLKQEGKIGGYDYVREFELDAGKKRIIRRIIADVTVKSVSPEDVTQVLDAVRIISRPQILVYSPKGEKIVAKMKGRLTNVDELTINNTTILYNKEKDTTTIYIERPLQ